MGWFETAKDSGLILGDEPLDLTHRFLKEIAESYEEGCERKPTLAEVVALLESGLKHGGGDHIADLQEREVTSVIIKTAKKRKDQRHQVGDVFAIPIGSNLFAFGRIMLDEKSTGTLIEVFKQTGVTKAYHPSMSAPAGCSIPCSSAVLRTGRTLSKYGAGSSLPRTRRTRCPRLTSSLSSSIFRRQGGPACPPPRAASGGAPSPWRPSSPRGRRRGPRSAASPPRSRRPAPRAAPPWTAPACLPRGGSSPEFCVVREKNQLA